MLQIQNLTIKLKNTDTVIVSSLNLSLANGQILALVGKNGSGKSTIVQTVMGNPNFEIVSGKIVFECVEINNLSADERSKLGIFLAFQTPLEIPGVNLLEYLKLIYNTHNEKKLSVFHFRKLAKELICKVGLDENFLERNLNEGFSGGEKKKCEMLQLLLLKPKLIILDEIDSGLDKAGLEIIVKTIAELVEKNNSSVIVISHYEKLLQELKVDEFKTLN